MSRLMENAMPSASPFDIVAATYDDVFSNSPIGRAQRRAVWAEMDRAFCPGQRILEINCGTGIDAARLALRGISVVACDSSLQMIAMAQKRAGSFPKKLPIRFRCVPTESIAEVAAEGPFDGVLSNFSGLNCIANLRWVSTNLASVLKPGGKAVLCVFGTFCLWELAWHLCRGNTRNAFRRLNRHGVISVLSPASAITVHYHSVRALRRSFAPSFRLIRRTGVGISIPPTSASSLVERAPWLFKGAAAIDSLLGRCPALRSIADHTVLTFERVAEDHS